MLVTQAWHSGTAFADIELEIAEQTNRVVAKRARIVTTYADEGPGLAPNPEVTRLVQQAVKLTEGTTARVVGSTRSRFALSANAAGESQLGNLIADAQRAALRTELAFSLASQARAELPEGSLTWGDLHATQPFGSQLMVVELTGQDVVALLEGQWTGRSHPTFLFVSGLRYTWNGSLPRGQRIVSVEVGNRPVDRHKTYRACINAFLAEGSEGFTSLASLPRSRSKLRDVDALHQYAREHKPLQPVTDGRIRRIDER
jgi:5'-nucleotidase